MSLSGAIETRLRSGSLRVELSNSELPFVDLCGFASRRNPRRAFLFVSKVLGKHVPVRPPHMRRVYQALAAKLDASLPGPVLFIALAETATGLGQGVHEEYVRRTGRADVLFIHSTRYRLRHRRALEFREPHSHAPDHIVYQPPDAEDAALFDGAATLVLIDDEMTTGRSFLNLVSAYRQRNAKLERVELVVLTDWLGERRGPLLASLPVPASIASLSSGSFEFTPFEDFEFGAEIDVTGNGESKDHILLANHGRLGRRRPPCIERAAAAALAACTPEQRILVLGTGEFIFPPFKVAEHLAELGYDVHYQSTTRSPMLLGNDIATRLEFLDNYHDSMPNFVYNVSAGQYDRILICYETANLPPGHELPRLLGAEPIFF